MTTTNTDNDSTAEGQNIPEADTVGEIESTTQVYAKKLVDFPYLTQVIYLHLDITTKALQLEQNYKNKYH